MRRHVTVLMVAGLVPMAAAAEQVTLDYKGALSTAAGPVVTATTVQFQLCRGGSLTAASACGGGLVLFTETVMVTPVDGVFSLRIGQTVPLDASLLDGAEGVSIEARI